MSSCSRQCSSMRRHCWRRNSRGPLHVYMLFSLDREFFLLEKNSHLLILFDDVSLGVTGHWGHRALGSEIRFEFDEIKSFTCSITIR
jgi:hypothetical protein